VLAVCVADKERTGGGSKGGQPRRTEEVDQTTATHLRRAAPPVVRLTGEQTERANERASSNSAQSSDLECNLQSHRWIWGDIHMLSAWALDLYLF
jgi:hypothetical protein